MNNLYGGGIPCRYMADQCCFRNVFGCCTILNDTEFKDNKCHFRKLSPEGENMYDLEKKNEKIAVG